MTFTQFFWSTRSCNRGAARLTRLTLFAILLASGAPSAFAQVDDHNPVGAMGTFEGVITTGCAYNVLNHSTQRAIDDIVVPGSIGKYPLKMTRYYVSRDFGDSRMGPGWRHEYSWGSGQGKVEYPNGNVWDNYCQDPVGVSDLWEVAGQTFRLADGGRVVFDGYGRASQVIDPYGQTTTITYDNVNAAWMKVTEPGGRYLYFVYTHQPAPNGALMVTRVEAHGLGDATVTDQVNYTYASVQTGGNTITTAMCLTRADYSDGTSATYTYETDNAPEQPTRGSLKEYPPVSTCNDVRYHGPMRRIAYVYEQGGPHGAISTEKYSASDGNKGVNVSSISPACPSPLSGGTIIQMPTDFTETRGDGPTRTFHYTALHIQRQDTPQCPNIGGGPPTQFLLNNTDFQGHSTSLGYDQTTWYLTSVTDANNNTTYYQRGPDIGQITKITHPDTTHIDYTYQLEPGAIGGHYMATVSNERQKVTIYTRDPNTHLVTRIDYPADANTPASYEQFTYNSFGQVLTHHLRNLAWESFVYDGRGLLTDKYNPKQSGVPGGSDPHTHYTYYTFGPWTDRVMTMTLPANFSGYQASETYEYDRDGSNVAVAGRGLVTKITHADGKYQSFGYDAYGNKLWEENELRQRTSYTYDDYKRVLTIQNPLNQTITNTYTPTNGTGTSPYRHTTNSNDTTTTPTGIVTKNIYDQNFRKISTTQASGTTLAATTTFGYDAVGNPTTVTDPLNHTTTTTYDNRNRKATVTDALNQTTTFNYDGASNVTGIVRPDNTTETKTYDALNRVLTDTVPQTATVNLTTTFTYNPSGTIASVMDAKGQVTTFGYNESDQKTRMTYPNSTDVQSWSYDAAHNVGTRTTVGGKTQYFGYDNRNRKIGSVWSNNVEWLSFAYDDANRLVTATNGTGSLGTNITSTVTRSYDPAGRLTLDQQAVTGLAANSVNYVYDADGKSIRLYVTGAGYDYTFSYDAMGRFEKISPTGGSVAFQYYYDAASNETQRYNFLNGGVTQIYTRDALNRMSRRDVIKGGTTLSYEVYGYDPMNRLISTSREDSTSDSFGYYLDGELNTAQYGWAGGMLAPSAATVTTSTDATTGTGKPLMTFSIAPSSLSTNTTNTSTTPTMDTMAATSTIQRSVTYNLDKAGNRLSIVDTGTTKTYAPNILNQYTSAEGLSVTNGSEHEIASYQGVNYTYINDGRVSAATDGVNNYSVAYDALGRCVKRTLNANTAYYIYDGERPILEYWSGIIIASNVYGKGIDEILMRTDIQVNGNQPYYYQQDHEGSVTHLTDASGNVIEKYRYDAFGKPTYYNGSGTQIGGSNYNNRFLLTGREFMGTWYEYRARFYHPLLGRFMSEDPKLFDAGDYNLFRYCHNDPEDLTDPMGLEENWAQTGPPISGNHVAQAIAMDYNQAMAQAQWNMRWSTAGAIGMGMVGYKTFIQGQFRVDAQPFSVHGRDPTGASGSIFTIQFKTSGNDEYSSYALRQDISEGTWDSKSQKMVWSNFKPDTAHPLSDQRSTGYGVTARDQSGHWELGRRPGTGLTSLNPLSHFNKFGQMMRTSTFGISRSEGSNVFFGSHTWSAIYQEGRAPVYQGIGQWFPASGE